MTPRFRCVPIVWLCLSFTSSEYAECPEFAAKLGMPVTVVPNTGHQLGKQYVGALLDQWLD